MNRPPLKTLLLGHPLIGLPIYGAGAFVLYQCWLDPSIWLFGVGALCIMSMAGKAADEASRYHAWKRAWDTMGNELPKRRNPIMRRLLGVILIVLLGLYLAANADQPGYGLALGWMIMVGLASALFLTLRSLMRRLRRNPAKAKIAPVSIVVARRPLMATGDVTSAYRALPEHCTLLLGAKR